MTKYTINASRKIHYLFEVEANNANEAIDEMNRIDISENAEDFSFEWEAFDIAEIKELEQ
jgi:hypothetical protein